MASPSPVAISCGLPSCEQVLLVRSPNPFRFGRSLFSLPIPRHGPTGSFSPSRLHTPERVFGLGPAPIAVTAQTLEPAPRTRTSHLPSRPRLIHITNRSTHAISAASVVTSSASLHTAFTSDSQPAEHRQRRKKTKAKICGVTRPEDASVAAAAGASFVGMILWPKAKRHVPPDVAREIAAAALAGGAQPVGVFVDESAEEIVAACQRAGVNIAQLHGDGARSALADLPLWLTTIYVLNVDTANDSSIACQLPDPSVRLPDWLLVDGLQGGSGEALDWSRLEVPRSLAKFGWILAGGLNPSNVAAAIAVAAPDVVDVSSGVCGSDKLAKDHDKVKVFVASALTAGDAEEA